MVARMLNNLKATLLKSGHFARAARVISRLTQLVPSDPTQRRDLGVSLVQAGECGQAIKHLRAYLEMAPTAHEVKPKRPTQKKKSGPEGPTLRVEMIMSVLTLGACCVFGKHEV